MSFEEPIMPPEGDGRGNFYESAHLNIEDLKEYLLDTAFEDEDALVEELTKRYGMARRENMGEMQMNMTRKIDLKKLRENFEKKQRGENTDEYMGTSLSGEEPMLALNLSLSTMNGNEYTLKIYTIENSSKQIRFEYSLE